MMEAVRNLLSYNLVDALGWTLIHSLWQAPAIFLGVVVALRYVPIKRSRLRYTVACAAILLFAAGATSTFLYSLESNISAANTVEPNAFQLVAHYASNDQNSSTDYLSITAAALQQYIPLIVIAWALGFTFFTLRLSGSLWYTYKLRSEARYLENTWSEYIRKAGSNLGIERLVRLAESSVITTPMVIGYLKPVILIPVGMVTGLTTEQLETVFVHELAHIRRHDFLFNFIQSLVETVFFFNPFVWMLSTIIRREREYCCDDLVIRQHGGRKAYAYALTQLAQAQLSAPAFVLALAEDKNQLLNRIKRIMETSAKNNSGKRRVILPALLLAAGLFCISWLGVTQEDQPRDKTLLAGQDTVIRKSEPGARFSRKSIITIDENGEPHEEIVEEFEGDEALRPLLHGSLPGISDSLPPPGIGPDNFQSWDEMEKALAESFRNLEGFGPFQGADASRFFDDFDENFRWEEFGPRLDSLAARMDDFRALENFKGFEDLERNLEQHLQKFEMEHLKPFERQMSSSNLERYESVLREKLVQDGYLSKNETIESLQWNDESLKVNGKVIREEDEQKYRELNRQYFDEPSVDK